MRYCVVKDTTIIVDGSLNTDNVMLQNARTAGFTADQVEILTQAEYDERKALESKPLPVPTAEDRIEQLENMILMMMEVM